MNSALYKYLIIITLFVFFQFLFIEKAYSQQTKIDSLLTLLKTDRPDTNKVFHLNLLASEYIAISDYATGLKYANEALVLANSIEVDNESGWSKGIAEAHNNIGVLYYFLGDYSNALENQNASLKINEKIGNQERVATTLMTIGAIYRNQGNYPNALKNFLSCLEIGETIQDKTIIAKAHNNIGIIYQEQEKYSEALENYNKSLAIKKQLNNKRDIATTYNNIANVYFHENNFSAALDNHEIALKIRKEVGDKQGILMSHNNMGITYQKIKNNPEALANYEAALEIAKEIHDKYGIAISLTNLSELQIKLNQLEEAKNNLTNALLLSKALGDKERIKNIYLNFSILDSIKKDWESAYKNHQLYVKYKDTLDNDQTKRKIIENSLNFEFKAEQDKKDAIAAEKQQNQKIIIYFISGALFLMVILAFFIYRSYKQKQKANAIIVQQKAEVEEKNRLIGEKHKEITDSINYAKRIQGALLKEEEHVSAHLPKHFILFLPKDVVSGDFYWNFEKTHTVIENSKPKTTEYWYGCIADCTGHGVPGAMMSMLGMSMLSDITSGDALLTPAEILDRLRNRIITELGQTGKDGENKDGMDASIFRLNRQTNELYWAGANNALYLYSNNELKEVKADKQPVAHHPIMKPFTNQVFQLQKGDIYYLITDGYADQFGGVKNKKFKYKQLEELLASIAAKSVTEQKETLKQTFINWKGTNEQTDDVTIAGLRV